MIQSKTTADLPEYPDYHLALVRSKDGSVANGWYAATRHCGKRLNIAAMSRPLWGDDAQVEADIRMMAGDHIVETFKRMIETPEA